MSLHQQRCKICSLQLEMRTEINKQILAGCTYVEIMEFARSQGIDLSHSSLSRHKTGHLKPQLDMQAMMGDVVGEKPLEVDVTAISFANASKVELTDLAHKQLILISKLQQQIFIGSPVEREFIIHVEIYLKLLKAADLLLGLSATVSLNAALQRCLMAGFNVTGAGNLPPTFTPLTFEEFKEKSAV